jgi:hypothetical protein
VAELLGGFQPFQRNPKLVLRESLQHPSQLSSLRTTATHTTRCQRIKVRPICDIARFLLFFRKFWILFHPSPVFLYLSRSAGKGGKNVKRGKNGNLEETRRDLLFKEFGQGPSPSSLSLTLLAEYAQVIRMLGGGRAELHCFDGVSRQGLIRGTMRRRVWINTVCLPLPPVLTFPLYLSPLRETSSWWD